MDNKLVRNERRKLTATYVNSIALVAIGVFAQALSVSIASALVMIADCGVWSAWIARKDTAPHPPASE